MPGNTVKTGVTSTDGSVGDSISFSYSQPNETIVHTREVFYNPATELPTGSLYTWVNKEFSGESSRSTLAFSVVDSAPEPNQPPIQ